MDSTFPFSAKNITQDARYGEHDCVASMECVQDMQCNNVDILLT